ncbi:MAG TPA: hypothetical protein VFQ27_11470 [Xanthobacteraceae bacterium]|nr:hypothetical protein [Xanthobacteraceae bacterium]
MRPIILAISVAVALIAAAPSKAAGEIRILGSPGGAIGPFVALFETVRASGERVVIDGPCLSACTLVLSLVPRDRICVTPRAVLGFHAARYVTPDGRVIIDPDASAIVLRTYPPAIRAWIARRGGLTDRVLLLRGRALASMFRHCR